MKHSLSLLNLEDNIKEIRRLVEETPDSGSPESKSVLCRFMMADEENPLTAQVFVVPFLVLFTGKDKLINAELQAHTFFFFKSLVATDDLDQICCC